jgi:hypothetical protein
MPSKKKFWRTIIKVEVLSEEMVDFDTLEQVAEAINTGDCVGRWEVQDQYDVNAKRMANLLHEVGSEPSFFMLDDEGNDINDG